MRKFRKPYRIKKRKSIFKSRFFWSGILIVIIFCGIFYLICFHSFFQIKEIKISGNSAFAEDRADKQKVLFEGVQKIIEEKINQKILFFSSKSIFLANFSEIKKEILKSFPPVDEINLKRKFPHTILVQVKERKPLAIFCPIRKSTTSNGVNQNDNCFFIDKEGIIFEPIVTRSEFVTLKKNIGWEINLGEKILGEEKLSEILEVESKLRNNLKITSEEILIVSDERFNAKTLEGWQIYFNFREDLGWQLTKLNAVLEKEIPHEKRKYLEYIDLRFGNFAPYKYK